MIDDRFRQREQFNEQTPPHTPFNTRHCAGGHWKHSKQKEERKKRKEIVCDCRVPKKKENLWNKTQFFIIIKTIEKVEK